MPQLQLVVKYRQDLGILLSASELRDRYLFGLPLRTKAGEVANSETLAFHIRAAQDALETYLHVKLFRQLITEDKDYHADKFYRWNYIHTTYPVVCPRGLTGNLNNVKQVDYPVDWLSSRKTTDGVHYHSRLYVIPNSRGNFSNTQQVIFSGLSPYMSYLNSNYIPNYWSVSYVTGLGKVPAELIEVVGKLAAISLLNLTGDLVLGLSGLGSASLSIDGLSQSTSAKQQGYQTRITQYVSELNKALPELQIEYGGLAFTAL